MFVDDDHIGPAGASGLREGSGRGGICRADGCSVACGRATTRLPLAGDWLPALVGLLPGGRSAAPWVLAAGDGALGDAVTSSAVEPATGEGTETVESTEGVGTGMGTCAAVECREHAAIATSALTVINPTRKTIFIPLGTRSLGCQSSRP